MFKKILLASDGSDAALRAVEVAIDWLQALPGTTVDIIHVVQPILTPWTVHTPSLDLDLEDFIHTSGEKSLETSVQRFREKNIPVRTMIKYGDPATEICAIAKENDYDLIIVGRRGIGPLRELAFGSVSHKICHLAPCPVLVVN